MRGRHKDEHAPEQQEDSKDKRVFNRKMSNRRMTLRTVMGAKEVEDLLSVIEHKN